MRADAQGQAGAPEGPGGGVGVDPADRAAVGAQLGRAPRGLRRVAARCGLGLPVVVEAAPLLEDGTPFPTLCWLTCPLARRRVSRLEQGGRVRELTARLEGDPDLRAALAQAEARHAAARAALLPPGAAPEAAARVRGGIGGAVGGGVKCLHAHYAHWKVDSGSPIGALVGAEVEPLDCRRPCVRDGRRDPAWREPDPPAGGVAPPGSGLRG